MPACRLHRALPLGPVRFGPLLVSLQPSPASALTDLCFKVPPCQPRATHFYALSHLIPATTPVTWVLLVSPFLLMKTMELREGITCPKWVLAIWLQGLHPSSRSPDVPGREPLGPGHLLPAGCLLTLPWLGPPWRGAGETKPRSLSGQGMWAGSV